MAYLTDMCHTYSFKGKTLPGVQDRSVVNVLLPEEFRSKLACERQMEEAEEICQLDAATDDVLQLPFVFFFQFHGG